MIAGNYTASVAITPNDLANFAPVGSNPFADAIFVGSGGTVKVVGLDGVTVVTFTCPTGFILPVRAAGVRTGGTASGLIALYYA